LLRSVSLDDDDTRQAMLNLYELDYVADPHSALAWKALNDDLVNGETGVFLCTAHPAKFREDVEDVLDIELELPDELAEVAEREVLSETISSDFEEFRPLLLKA
jgi:threonine synthase